MKSIELLESKNTNVLIIDCQPEYSHWCNNIMPVLCKFLLKQKGNIFALYNGTGQTDDDVVDVDCYFMEYGIDSDFMDSLTFIEKEYGFFRSWMDQGVTDHIILKVIRAMITNKINDSSDLDLDLILNNSDFEIMNNCGFDYYEDGIYMPDFMSIAQLKNISPFYLCGGGRTQCLREIELLCNAFNIRYKRIDKLIYG